MSMPVFTEEAKSREKWCPFALSLGTLVGPRTAGEPDTITAGGPQNRGYQMGGGLHNCMCIGKQCMGWRFARTNIKNPDAPDGDLISSEDTHGYCGLAGIPGASR